MTQMTNLSPGGYNKIEFTALSVGDCYAYASDLKDPFVYIKTGKTDCINLGTKNHFTEVFIRADVVRVELDEVRFHLIASLR